MKKTLLRISLLGFVAAALLLTSCESPASLDVSEVSYARIGSVENIQVTGYTGVNLITWDPVVDAEDYSIYRKEKPAGKDWGEYNSLNVSVKDIKYADIISDSNVLKDDSEYTYKVVANAASRLNTVGSNYGEASYEIDPEKFPATAPQFPARGTALPVTVSAAAITVDNVFGMATLTWTSSNASPAITYRLEKSGSSSWTPISTTVAEANLSGDGYIDARISAYFASGTYYSVSGAVYVEPVAYDVQHLDSISANLDSATRSGETNQVIITYTKVKEATAYVLQKAKTNSVGAVLSWVDVDTAAVDLGDSFYVTDTIDADAWRYRLFVRTANGISNADTATVAKVTDPAVTGNVTATRQVKTADTAPGDDLDDQVYEIDFAISGVTEGASYQLQYREIGTSNQDDTTDPAEVGRWTLGPSVTATGADLSAKVFHIYFEPPVQRQGYEYRVLGTAEGKTTSSQLLVYSITGISELFGGSGHWFDEQVYAYAVKPALSVSGYISAATTYTIASITPQLQPGETVQVYAQKRITTLATSATIVAEVTHLGTITAAATAPATITIPSPGTNTGDTTYAWTNVSLVYDVK
jgi:hypothetical protein